MELEVELHDKKIKDLNQDLIKRLWKQLTVADIVNICTVNPSWEWILFLPKPCSYINKWKWIDRRICTTLYSDLPTPSTGDICKAVEQHFNQMQFDLHFSLIRAPPTVYVRVTCLLFFSILSNRENSIYPVHLLHRDSYVSLHVVNSTGPTLLHVHPMEYHPPLDVYVYPPGFAVYQLIGIELERSLKRRRARFFAFDSILYVLELSLFTMHSYNIFIELQAILRTLSPKHTFGIVIIDDVGKKEESGMDLFMDYAMKLGFAYDSPLMTAPMNWRIWHVEGGNDLIKSREDILEWVCQDVIWRRMQE